MRKKGQGISINVIIVAALAILVLFLLALIFTGKIALFRTETSSCETNGGRCQTVCDEEAGEIERNSWNCENDNDVCCFLGS